MRSMRIWVVLLGVCLLSSTEAPRTYTVQLSPFQVTGLKEPARNISVTLQTFEVTGQHEPPRTINVTLKSFEVTGVRP